jgi:hypothetical protein
MASAPKPTPLNIEILIQVALARMLSGIDPDLLTMFRACLPANAVGNADAGAIRCYPSAGKHSLWYLAGAYDLYR